MLGYVSSCYKAICSKDGFTYCLRRIHGTVIIIIKIILFIYLQCCLRVKLKYRVKYIYTGQVN